jgi:hypothetical protein
MCCIDGQENKYSVLNECSRMLKYNITAVKLIAAANPLLSDLLAYYRRFFDSTYGNINPFAVEINSNALLKLGEMALSLSICPSLLLKHFWC